MRHSPDSIRPKSFRKELYKNRILLLMLLPAIIYVIIFCYIPMGGIVIAFKNYNYTDGIFKSPWNGLQNFKFLLISNKLWPLTRNTLLYNLAFMSVGTCIQLALAVMFSELKTKWYKKVAQSSMLLPFFISWVVVASIMLNIFGYEHGVLNNVLTALHMQRVDIYANPNTFPIVLIFVNQWKNAGYGSIIYLAAITGIDQEIYEAASIDGANIWQRIFKITLPCVKPTVVIMLLLMLGQVFRGDFGMFYQIVKNNQVLLGSSDIIDTFVYRSLISSPDIGMSAAAGLYQSVMCFITIMIADFAVKKFEPDYALF